MIVGIDAAGVRHGGVVTHLVELLRAADPVRDRFTKVVVWGGSETLGRLDPRPWLEVHVEPALDGGLLRRFWWQWWTLPARLQAHRCDVLLAPGNYHLGRFRPVVVNSQNLLPFAPRERARYGWTNGGLRLALLGGLMRWSIRRSDVVLAQTEAHREALLAAGAPRQGAIRTVHLGIDDRFRLAPRPPRTVEERSAADPFRILYVSTVDRYKHQWHVADAVARLGREGLPVHLDLVGASIGSAIDPLRATLQRVDPDGRWIRYRGMIAYDEIAPAYQGADLYVCASSCEAFGQVLTEAMAAGLPIVCADRPGFREILGPAGLFVDPEDPAAIAEAIRGLLGDPRRREVLAREAHTRAREFTWERCARETFALLAGLA